MSYELNRDAYAQHIWACPVCKPKHVQVPCMCLLGGNVMHIAQYWTVYELCEAAQEFLQQLTQETQ